MPIETLIDSTIQALFKDIRFADEPAGLYDPLRYMINGGGKRLRPRLCLPHNIFPFQGRIR